MLRWTLLRLVTYPVLTFTVGWLRWPPLRVRCWQPPPHPHRGHFRQRRWMWSQDEARHVCSFYCSSSSTWLKLKVSLRSYSKIRVVARRGIGGFSRSCLGFDSRSSRFPVLVYLAAIFIPWIEIAARTELLRSIAFRWGNVLSQDLPSTAKQWWTNFVPFEHFSWATWRLIGP